MELPKTCPKCSMALVERKGVSKKTNKPYFFYACTGWKSDGTGCDYTWNPPKQPTQQPPVQSQPQPPQSPPSESIPWPISNATKTAPPINPPSQLQEEIKTSNSDILVRIGNLVNEITQNTQTLTEELLTRKELELSGENFNLSKLYAVQYGETRTAEMNYKKELDEIIGNLKINQPDITITKAKEEAEKDLWDKKVNIVTGKNKLISYQTILDSVKYILFAIKDRVKMLRGNR